MYILSNIKKLYDGTSASSSSLHQNIDVLVEDGMIKDVLPHKKDTGYRDFAYVDCSDKFVTPGLVDCHAHITISGIGKQDIDLMNSQSGLLYVEKILYTTLVNGGVTTARDIGGATDFIKRMINDKMMIGPRLKIAIAMLSTTGGTLKVSSKEIIKNYKKIKNINRNKNCVIGFGITENNISNLKKADGLVVGSAICKKITISIKKRQNPVTNVYNVVNRLRNKIK